MSSSSKRLKKAFTIVELSIVIVLIAILFSMAAVRFVNLGRKAREAVEEATVDIIRLGLNTYFVESVMIERRPEYPVELDDAAYASYADDSNPFFGYVLEKPGVTARWYKLNSTTYRGPTEREYIYNNSSGDFGPSP